MSWTPHDIRAELHSISKLLSARPGVFDLEVKLCTALKRKLQLMSNVSSTDLVLCYDALKEANLPQTMHCELIAVLDKLAVEEVEVKTAGKVIQGAQDCRTFYKYLTEEDISALQKSNMWEGCTTVAKRMKLLGIRGMKENLKRLACGILVWHEQQRTNKLPIPDSVYNLSQHLVHTLQTVAMEVPASALSLAQYPDDPGSLSSSHFDASFQGGKPMKADFPGLAGLLNSKVVPVRMSSASVTLGKDPCLFKAWQIFFCAACMVCN